MVECEYTTVVFTNVARIVLIDTWWNVNDKVYTIYNADGVVLIDTWWNVNAIQEVMVSQLHHVLIDTWWNVNQGRTNSSPCSFLF